MVKIHVEQSHSLDEVLRHIDAGEAVQLIRGGQVVAVVNGLDDLHGWAKMGAEQLAKILPVEDFSDWNPPRAPKGGERDV